MSYICWRGPGLAWCRDCSCCNLSSVFSYIRWNATVMRSERRWISELASCEAASTSHNKCCSRRCSTFWNNFQNIQGGPKNCTPHSRPLFCQILTDFQFVATLPCNFIVNRLFSDTNVSQGSAATYARYVVIYNDHLTAKLLQNLPVKEFLKSVKTLKDLWPWGWRAVFGPCTLYILRHGSGRPAK